MQGSDDGLVEGFGCGRGGGFDDGGLEADEVGFEGGEPCGEAGEEGGLVGCTLVLAIFGFFFYRAWLVMVEASEPYYKMLVAGIIGLIGFHTVVNLAMILQLAPVVGLWLPFLSYGGTAMWLCMACVGLLLNIRRQERPVLFS